MHEASQLGYFTNARVLYEAFASPSDIRKAEDLASPEFTRAIHHVLYLETVERLDILKPQVNMKALAGLLWAGAAFEAYTVAGEALVYTSESWLRQTPATPPSISPHTARLLFAQRLGLSQYHSLQDADDSTLGILNTYGGEQQQIFARENGGGEKLLLVVEGVDEGSLRPQDIVDKHVN